MIKIKNNNCDALTHKEMRAGNIFILDAPSHQRKGELYMLCKILVPVRDTAQWALVWLGGTATWNGWHNHPDKTFGPEINRFQLLRDTELQYEAKT